MLRMPRPIPITLFALLLLGISVLAAQDTESISTKVRGQDAAEVKLTLSNACAMCHAGTNAALDDRKRPLACSCQESLLWKEADPHRNAARTLFDRAHNEASWQKSQDILSAIGQEKIVSCMKCHATDLENNHFESFRSGVPKNEPLLNDFATEGVTCVACHSVSKPAPEDSDWIEKHHGTFRAASLDSWRKLTPEAKASAGMRDLSRIDLRTQQCASCHIGNQAEGKFVTHEMYAAGHPPLPAFEMGEFTAAMPPHWESWRQKRARWLSQGPDKLPETFAQLLDQYGQAPHEQAELVIVGTVASYQSFLRAVVPSHPSAPGNAVARIDFARFDCFACHHDLSQGQWRQNEAVYRGQKPGRPRLREWPQPLLNLAFSAEALLGGDSAPALQEEYQKKAEALRAAATMVPFGNSEKMRAEAEALDAWLQTRLTRLGSLKMRLTRDQILRLAADAATQAAAEPYDFDSARQVAWALRTVLKETGTFDQPEIRELFMELEAPLALKLRQDTQSPARGSAWSERSQYEPGLFSARMKELARLLSPYSTTKLLDSR